MEDDVSLFGDELRNYPVLGSPHDGGFERHVLVCTSRKGCLQGGGFEVKKRFIARRSDERLTNFKISSVESMGYCDRGPVAVVYPDNVWYDGLSPDDADVIVDEHIKNGAPVERLAFDPGLPDDFVHVVPCTFVANCGPEGGHEVYRFFSGRARGRDDVIVTASSGCPTECSMGPVCCVYPSGEWYAGLTERRAEDVWASHVERGEPSKYRVGALTG